MTLDTFNLQIRVLFNGPILVKTVDLNKIFFSNSKINIHPEFYLTTPQTIIFKYSGDSAFFTSLNSMIKESQEPLSLVIVDGALAFYSDAEKYVGTFPVEYYCKLLIKKL